MTEKSISQERLKELLHYNPDTGIFTWTVPRQGVKAKAGSVNGKGYRQITIDYKLYQVHRLAFLYMTGEWPKDQLDHINHIRTDNRWLNLREATCQENQRNRTKNKDNTSGVTGVYRHTVTQQWYSQIKDGGKNKYLGYFTDKFEAICARKSAEVKYGFHENHGE